MKKFLAMLMLLAMCFTCAAMAETTDEDLAAAKTYLFMMYKDLPEQRHHQDRSAGQQDGHHRCG